jgi:anti-anti-sigma factor
MLEDVRPLVLTLTGEYDISRTAELRDAILCRHAGEDQVVVDVSGVTFLDSSGLRALLEVRSVLAERATTFTLMDPSDVVSRLLRITDTATVFGLPAE